MALELQKDIPDLRRLMADVASSSNEWEEYFKVIKRFQFVPV